MLPPKDEKVSCMLPRSIAPAATLAPSLPAQALKHPRDAWHNVARTGVGQRSLPPLKSGPTDYMRKGAEPDMPLEAGTHAGVGQKGGC